MDFLILYIFKKFLNLSCLPPLASLNILHFSHSQLYFFLFFHVPSRKRTLLSLAKLHLVTEEKLGPDPEVVQAELDAVEVELALLMHQEQLPAAVLQAYDLDPNTMRVLTASELIEVCFLIIKKQQFPATQQKVS